LEYFRCDISVNSSLTHRRSSAKYTPFGGKRPNRRILRGETQYFGTNAVRRGSHLYSFLPKQAGLEYFWPIQPKFERADAGNREPPRPLNPEFQADRRG
jgi:hypothetical protein